MLQSLFLAFVAIHCHVNFVLTKDIGDRNAEIEQEEDFDPVKYLEQLNYLDEIDPVKNRHHAPDSVKQATKEFQEYAGLPVTGRLDKLTIGQMHQPRCGNPDVIKPSQRHKDNDPNAPLSYKLQGNKWSKHDLSYRFRDYTADMPVEQQRTAVANALKMWSAVTPLNFEKKDSGAVDILVSYGTKNHGDGYPFDGRGHVLAHAFNPGAVLSGDLHFDDDETWSLDGGDVKGGTRNIETVAAHELGHSLGLQHSTVRDSLMYAWYTGEKPHLHQDDIDGVRAMYGPRVTEPDVPVTGPPVVDPTSSSGKKCDLRIDAIAQVGAINIIYVFSGPHIYTMTQHGIFNQRLISEVFKGAPPTPDAVVHDTKTGKTFFFKDRAYWRFTGYELDQSFPKPLYLNFQHVDAALHKKWDGTIYLFQGDGYTPWTETMHQYPTGYPKKIREGWYKAPSYVDAAFQSSVNGYMYLFHQDRVYKFYNAGGSQMAQSGSSKSIKQYWLGCGTRTPVDEEHLFN